MRVNKCFYQIKGTLNTMKISTKSNDIKSSSTKAVTQTALIMDEDIFWAIVERSLQNSTSSNGQLAYLTSELEALSPSDIVAFQKRMNILFNDINTSKLWSVAFSIKNGCSDDSFDYFKSWVISKGKDIYYVAKNNPDRLADTTYAEYCEFEIFGYVAIDAFEKKTGEDIYGYLRVK